MARRLTMVLHGAYPVDPRVARQIRVAIAEGYEVSVVAMRAPGQPAREVVDGAEVVRLPIAHRRGGSLLSLVAEYVGFAALSSVALAIGAVRRRPSVVQVHNPPDFLVVAALFPRLLGARVLFDVHDLSPDMFDMRFRGRRGARTVERVLRLLERGAAAVSDAVITVHEPYRRELIARGVPEHKTEVVMNSLDEALLPPPRRPPAGDGFRVVYHGTVTPHYGVDLLVEAVALASEQVQALRLDVYGEGDHLPAVRRRAEELRIADRVSFTGRNLPQREVLERVATASVGVVPNLPTRLNRFALSSKLLEYVVLGVPAVSADLPTIREHFGDAEVRFFRAGDAEALAEGLVDVARHPDRARRRAEAARRRYAEYRWSVNGRRYADVLNGLDARSG